MAKKISIALIVILVASGLYALIARSKLINLRKDLDKQWPAVEEQYNGRVVLMGQIMEMAKKETTKDDKFVADFIQNEKIYNDNKNNEPMMIENKVQAINKMSLDMERLIMTLDKYPELKNSSEFQALVNRYQEDKSVETIQNQYNDSVVKYNMTLHRIRYRFVTSLFRLPEQESLKLSAELQKMAVPKIKKK